MSETLDAILCLFLLGVLITAALPISSYRTSHRSNEGAPHPLRFLTYRLRCRPVIAKIVLLYLTVYNCDTGAVLYESARQMPVFSVSGDRLADCRQEGVSQAHALRLITVRLIPMHQPTYLPMGTSNQVNMTWKMAGWPQSTAGRLMVLRELASDASAH